MIGVEEARTARMRIVGTGRIARDGTLLGDTPHAGRAVYDPFFEELAAAGHGDAVLVDPAGARSAVLLITDEIRAAFPECAWADLATVVTLDDGRTRCSVWCGDHFEQLVSTGGFRLAPREAR